MTIYNPEGNHYWYTDTDRHWHPLSEKFTGADSLVTAQRNGWRLAGIAYRERVQLGAGRFTILYHFKLVRDDEKILMPIVNNPFVERMLQQHRINVISATERETQEMRQLAKSLLG